ncbi:dihydropteroate synthase [Methylomarinum vadi]|uniref:dihydropteroate synthase n=1 Tax=Methylomarinum vadi TaxID=438855 RepID=UPI0004DF4CF0|nr:dihydropteroate synthase [Methylomarinum vadi]
MFENINKPLIMGILNVTPDSFSDGGRFTVVDTALRQCEKMLKEGADIIDIGGESTRPGSEPVNAAEQIRRVVPIIAKIRQQISREIPISIDTTLSAVAEAALQAGANIINDISSGQGDDKILPLAAASDVPIILMHMQGTPLTMQDNPYYDDAVTEILAAIRQRVDAALAAGIAKRRIAIDPGIGFGKRKQDNIDLLAHLSDFVATGYSVLLGTSRKRFMGGILNVEQPAELVTATAVTTALGVMAGVRMFRVHDVKENRQAADLAWAIKQASD